ncbi:PREDICTED: cuticle protein 38-like [Dufourea novaeangliae]|uniref:cuticle protein 38-like n=1 Tax=Dufourea novaeangliae TaxID=178035 RepID=UPI000767CB9E|nr:PREDICTED: cuticle protein 38-like [Dufourea novaeangliae]
MYKFIVLTVLVACAVAAPAPEPGFLASAPATLHTSSIVAAPVAVAHSVPVATSYANTYKVSLKSPLVATAPYIAAPVAHVAAPIAHVAAPTILKSAPIVAAAPAVYAHAAPVYAHAAPVAHSSSAVGRCASTALEPVPAPARSAASAKALTLISPASTTKLAPLITPLSNAPLLLPLQPTPYAYAAPAIATLELAAAPSSYSIEQHGYRITY